MSEVVFDFSALQAFAVTNNFSQSRGGVPVYDLSIEVARAKVFIVDGNKVPAEDGSQALTLKLGKRKVSLDAVKKGATRINASAEQVEAFTAALTAALAAGAFDEAIRATQAAAKQAAEDAKTKGAEVVTETGDEAVLEENVDIPGLDLDSLE
jgi:hypothetical protein